MTEVGTILSTQLVTVSPDDTVAEAARHMSDREVGIVLIREGQRITGIFSERDLVVRVVSAGRDPSTTRVGDVATHEMKAVGANTPILEVARSLDWKHLRHLAVLEGEEAVGVVSMRDVLAALARQIDDAG